MKTATTELTDDLAAKIVAAGLISAQDAPTMSAVLGCSLKYLRAGWDIELAIAQGSKDWANLLLEMKDGTTERAQRYRAEIVSNVYEALRA